MTTLAGSFASKVCSLMEGAGFSVDHDRLVNETRGGAVVGPFWSEPEFQKAFTSKGDYGAVFVVASSRDLRLNAGDDRLDVLAKARSDAAIRAWNANAPLEFAVDDEETRRMSEYPERVSSYPEHCDAVISWCVDWLHQDAFDAKALEWEGPKRFNHIKGSSILLPGTNSDDCLAVLQELVRSGLVETRGAPPSLEYRATPARSSS